MFITDHKTPHLHRDDLKIFFSEAVGVCWAVILLLTAIALATVFLTNLFG